MERKGIKLKAAQVVIKVGRSFEIMEKYDKGVKMVRGQGEGERSRKRKEVWGKEIKIKRLEERVEEIETGLSKVQEKRENDLGNISMEGGSEGMGSEKEKNLGSVMSCIVAPFLDTLCPITRVS